MTSTDLIYLDAADLTQAYACRSLSPVEVTQACLDRIDALNPGYGAYVLVDHTAALAAAKASEQRWMTGNAIGPADGVPASIKDLCLTKGWPTLRGSGLIDPDGQTWDEDAPCTARLREAGAVLLGKTSTPELGWKGVTDNPLGDVARNPYDRTKTAGGSSGGAAVAAALGMGVLHIGTDGGGSIRIPAAFSGIFGLKPTFGRVPAYPASAFGDLAHIGPMTRRVADAALMLDIISRPDCRDPQALPPPQGSFLAALDAPASGLRGAYSPDLGFVKVSPEVADIVAAAVEKLRVAGIDLSGPGLEIADPKETFHALWFSGAALALSRFPAEKRGACDPGLQQIARLGGGYPHMDYLTAGAARTALREKVSRYFGGIDILLTPAMPIPAFGVGIEVPESSGMTRWTDWTGFTYPFNLTQNPAAVVPCGMTKSGLPVAIHVVGRRHQDQTVLRFCRAIEQALGPLPRPLGADWSGLSAPGPACAV